MIHRNQNWLAKYFGVSKGYISMVLNNKCKMPLAMIERLLVLTHMRFEDLFSINGRVNHREFYGKYIASDDNLINNRQYKKFLDKKKKL
jgi:hypothetical protein